MELSGIGWCGIGAFIQRLCKASVWAWHVLSILAPWTTSWQMTSLFLSWSHSSLVLNVRCLCSTALWENKSRIVAVKENKVFNTIFSLSRKHEGCKWFWNWSFPGSHKCFGPNVHSLFQGGLGVGQQTVLVPFIEQILCNLVSGFPLFHSPLVNFCSCRLSWTLLTSPILG